MRSFIAYDRSIIPACDIASLDHLARMVAATADLPGIGGYKIGLELALRSGLPRIVKTIRAYSPNLPIIYDHQKGGNDIPEMGSKFAAAVSEAGVQAVILFPFAGPAAERAWIKEAQDAGLTVLVGGHMTHAEFTTYDNGFLPRYQIERIYCIAWQCGVRDFVVPGNKRPFVAHYRELLKKLAGDTRFQLYAPGFVAQGGKISEAGAEAGEYWHAIVGTAIYRHETADAIRAAAQELTAEITRTA